MNHEAAVSEHYTHGGLLEAIRSALLEQGKQPDEVTVDDLAPVDEFHIGGRNATDHLLEQLEISSADQVLDVGCGLGGAARYVASRHGCSVKGIDLTPEYVEVGRSLNTWAGVDQLVTLYEGSALNLPFEAASFDAAYMLHVGMNIREKGALFAQISNVLRAGGRLGVYDIMQLNPGELEYPVPWAEDGSTSMLDTTESYCTALKEAGFEVLSENSRQHFALDFFRRVAEQAKQGGPAVLGLHTLMKESSVCKIRNMIRNIREGLVAPFEIIARRR